MTDSLFPHAYSSVLAELSRRLAEPPPARIQILSGPRQVGKTHLLRALEGKAAGGAVYAAADAPAAALPGWWEAQWRAAEEIAHARGRALLLLDEIQYLPDWGRRLKAEYDRTVHAKVPIHIVATGSSSLQLGRGRRETMAGRFELLKLLHWPARELVRQLGVAEDRAADLAVRFGTYPGAIGFVDDPERWRAYVRDAIIEPAIGRDIMVLAAIRKPALLRQVFAVAAGHPAEIVSLQKLRGQLADPGAIETVAHYLHVLEEAYLVAPLEKLSAQAVRRRAAPPKLVVLNQGTVGALAPQTPPGETYDPRLLGRWVENACLALAWNAGQAVRYWRQEPHDVDAVISGSWGRWAIEVATGEVDTIDLAGLLAFIARHRGYRPLVLCDPGQERVAAAVGVEPRTWRQFLLEGPPS
jgi:predicted AAA+ superfamily ATPase